MIAPVRTAVAPRITSPDAKTKQLKTTNAQLICRMLALGWRYRAGSLLVLAQQCTLVLLTLAQLGLAGLGIDVLRRSAQPDVTVNWPLGWQPPASWGTLAQVELIAAGILISAISFSLMRYWSIVSAAVLMQRLVVQLRTDVYDKLQRLSFRFFDANQTGSIINRVAGDVQAVRMFVDGVIIQVLSTLLSLGFFLAYMFSMHVPLTLACLATTPLLWVGSVMFSRVVRPAYQRASELGDALILRLSENFQGIHVVKGFAREADEISRFAEANGQVLQQKSNIFRKISIFQPIMGGLTQLNMMILLAYGGYLVIHGQLALGSGMFVFANLLTQFANQVGQVTNIANTIQTSLNGAQRVFEVLDAPEEVESPKIPIRPARIAGELEFRSVDFSYLPEHSILSDISFCVKPGQCVAIVGSTGSGKSTLLSLIPRFYDCTGGCVRIDGVDVRDWDLKQLRRSIGLVFQESFLFSNTVAANIAFGHPDATPQAIEEAARVASAHEFIIDMPDGYDTLIGEHGCNLSGGQRQRLAIARAMLLKPPILLLDDALAAIDPGTEHEIMQAMDQAMQGRTTFIVAHRLSTLRRADLVIVLHQGRIVQQGTHEQLMREAGHYLQSARIQIAPEAAGKNSPRRRAG